MVEQLVQHMGVVYERIRLLEKAQNAEHQAHIPQPVEAQATRRKAAKAQNG